MTDTTLRIPKDRTRWKEKINRKHRLIFIKPSMERRMSFIIHIFSLSFICSQIALLSYILRVAKTNVLRSQADNKGVQVPDVPFAPNPLF